MKRVLFGAAILVIVAALLGSWSCSRGYSGPVESISIGTTTSEVNSLILIAEEQGYFADNGIDLARKIYGSGVAALDGVLNGEVDIATGSEFALVGRVLSGEDIRTIASINRSSIEYLAARVDRGINGIEDLKGKTIGVPLGSRPEFSLDRYLYLRGIDVSEVTLSNVRVTESVNALAGGEVDAVTAWQPYIDRIREQMGDGVVVWKTQEDQPSFTLLMSKGTWTNENPALIERFLKSLLQAEAYIAGHPEEARAFIREKLGYEEGYMASVWTDYHFSVLLDQSIVVAMEDVARWLIKHDSTGEKQVPDFLDHIYVDGLEQVKPEAVNIIR